MIYRVGKNPIEVSASPNLAFHIRPLCSRRMVDHEMLLAQERPLCAPEPVILDMYAFDR